MEGPSLFLASEQLQPFTGKRILEVRGNTKIDKERCEGQVVSMVMAVHLANCHHLNVKVYSYITSCSDPFGSR